MPVLRVCPCVCWKICAPVCVCVCVCVCVSLHVSVGVGVWGWEGCRWTACEGLQFRRPVLRITWQPYPMKAYAQMNLLSNWVNKRGRVEGWSCGGGVHTAAVAPARPACLSAYISHHCPLSLRLFLLPFPVAASFSQRALRFRLYFSLSLSISLVRSCSRNPIVLLGNSLFLNWIGRLSSRCTNRVLSSYADRQKTVKMTFTSFPVVLTIDSWY